MMLAFDADDDALRVNRINHTVTAGKHNSSRVAGGNAFHSSTNDWSFRHEQRHGLTLHVGAHQSAVLVIVLEERHQ